jgi:hypothetical protein
VGSFVGRPQVCGGEGLREEEEEKEEEDEKEDMREERGGTR